MYYYNKTFFFNKVAEEIANLHGINFTELQVAMLQKWLSFCSENNPNGLEDTFYEDLNITMPEDDIHSDEFVARSYYILNSWPKEKSIQFMINHMFPSDRQ